MQEFAKKEAHKSADEFASDKAAIAQNKIITEVKNTMQVAKRYLRSGIDTIGTKTQLQTIERDYNTAIDGVFVNGGTAQTFRNLTATSKILTELLNKAQGRKLRLDTHQQ